MEIDRRAVLAAQGLTERDLKRNRSGKLTEEQRLAILGRERAGLWIVGVLGLLLGVAMPLVIDRRSAMLWELSIGINALWVAPIVILQLLFRRKVNRGRVDVIDGAIDGYRTWRTAMFVVINGKRYPIRPELAALLPQGQAVRLFAIARAVVAIEPV